MVSKRIIHDPYKKKIGPFEKQERVEHEEA